MSTVALGNGTRYRVGREWVVTRLPNGQFVRARVNADTPRIAAEMHTTAVDLTVNHDPLHARLTDWLGLPHSYSLMSAAGNDTPPWLAELEEAAVMAVQRLMIEVNRPAS